jgi:hypothetical protein
MGAAAMSGGGGTAVGDGALALTGGAAYGNTASAGTATSTALGNNASAAFASSTAVGAGAVTTRANQVVVGTASETYTLPGIGSAASSAAQSGPISLVTTDPSGNLASDGGALFSGLSGLGQQVDENTEGIAMALAMEAPYVPPGQKFAMSGGVGFFQDEAAFALGAGLRVNPNLQLSAGVGVGFRENTVGGRVGLTYGW